MDRFNRKRLLGAGWLAYQTLEAIPVIYQRLCCRSSRRIESRRPSSIRAQQRLLDQFHRTVHLFSVGDLILQSLLCLELLS